MGRIFPCFQSNELKKLHKSVVRCLSDLKKMQRDTIIQRNGNTPPRLCMNMNILNRLQRTFTTSKLSDDDILDPNTRLLFRCAEHRLALTQTQEHESYGEKIMGIKVGKERKLPPFYFKFNAQSVEAGKRMVSCPEVASLRTSPASTLPHKPQKGFTLACELVRSKIGTVQYIRVDIRQYTIGQ